MNSDRKDRIMGSIVIILGSLMGLVLSYTIPFPPMESFLFLIEVVLFIVMSIIGVIYLILTLVIKMPPLTGDPIAMGGLLFTGSFFLIFSLIGPEFLFPSMFNVGIVLVLNGGFYMWLYLKQKHHEKEKTD